MRRAEHPVLFGLSTHLFSAASCILPRGTSLQSSAGLGEELCVGSGTTAATQRHELSHTSSVLAKPTFVQITEQQFIPVQKALQYRHYAACG